MDKLIPFYCCTEFNLKCHDGNENEDFFVIVIVMRTIFYCHYGNENEILLSLQ